MTKHKLISLLCPLAFLVFGIWIRISCMSFQKRDAMFPSLISYVTIAIALIDLVSEFRRPDHKDRFKNVNFVRLIACVAVLFLYVFLLKKVGFFVDTMLLCGFTMWILGYRRWKVLIPCSILISAVVFGVFYGLMKVPLPTIFL